MLAAFLFFYFVCSLSKPTYCQPTQSCWPTAEDVSALKSQLSSNALLLTIDDNEYYQYSKVMDMLYYQFPAWVLVIQQTSDIQAGVRWAKKYNIQISIKGSGHSYSGKFIISHTLDENNYENSFFLGNNTLMIQLSKLRQYSISDDNNYGTFSAGYTWYNVYTIVHEHKRIIVGGGDNSVGLGGYIQGGGHSPITPSYGLASDWVTGFSMVDSNGDIQIVTNSTKNESISNLFWGLRGGGGGTFGIVVNTTFVLHDPSKLAGKGTFVSFTCIWPFYDNITNELIAPDVLDYIWNFILTDMDQRWGGYIAISSTIIKKNGGGDIAVTWLLPDTLQVAKQNTESIYNYKKDSQTTCYYEGANTSREYARVYSDNAIIPDSNLNHNLSMFYVNSILDVQNTSHPLTIFVGSTLTLISGATRQFSTDYSSVNPVWRNGRFAATIGTGWNNSHLDNENIEYGIKIEQLYANFGVGIYSNEENPECNACSINPSYQNSWGIAIWGQNHYSNLKEIKQFWDPNNVFWCNHCIGDDD